MALDVEKHIVYWKDGAEEALQTAELLIANGRYSFGLFFLHFTLEKILKALVTQESRETPAKTHDLLFLCRRAALNPPSDVLIVLSEFQAYCIAGRYAESPSIPADKSLCEREIIRAKGAYEWLQQQLNK